MPITRLSLNLLTVMLLFLGGINANAQDIRIINEDSLRPAYHFDTPFLRINQTLQFNVAPNSRHPRNTIFINPHIDILHCKLSSFFIDWSFLQHLTIESTEFLQPALVDSANFDTLIINNSIFMKEAVFRDMSVPNLSFQRNFGHKYLFQNCKFKNANFYGSTFFGNIAFSNCTFTGRMVFDSVELGRSFYIKSLKIDSAAICSFINTELPDTVDLSYSGSIPQLDFTRADFSSGRIHHINLYQADLQRVNLNYRFFKLCFSDSTKRITIDEKEAIYDGLLQQFKQRGQLDSYAFLDIEYKEFKAKNGPLGFLWWIPKIWWNFGYNREWVFWWTAGLLAIFTSICFFKVNYLLHNVYQPGHIHGAYSGHIFERLWYSFVYTAIVFFSLSLKLEKINFKTARERYTSLRST